MSVQNCTLCEATVLGTHQKQDVAIVPITILLDWFLV